MEIPTEAGALVRNDNVVRGALPSANSNFSAQQNDTERVRLGTITDHARHDLAARPAGKFQFVALTHKDKHKKYANVIVRRQEYDLVCGG